MKAKLEPGDFYFSDYREPYCAALLGIMQCLLQDTQQKCLPDPCDSRVVQKIATLGSHHDEELRNMRSAADVTSYLIPSSECALTPGKACWKPVLNCDKVSSTHTPALQTLQPPELQKCHKDTVMCMNAFCNSCR